uniref:Uncharacterized protein n=1 Tax=Arsenophonus endosymbiont of Trialeurodes vaporariorum TaxID=235567 RepID=A0A3B0LYL8_9GAMM
MDKQNQKRLEQPSNLEDMTTLTKDLVNNPWSKVYWFARMLLNSDQYSGIGKDSARLLKAGT